MKNATVAALLYELLFEVYRKINHDRKGGWLQSLPDENGALREAFDHESMGCWEWSSSALAAVGLLRPFKTTKSGLICQFCPLVTLDECRDIDFSKFETFDNYCVAMFSFGYLYTQINGSTPRELINLSNRSSFFLEAVAAKDDIFRILDSGQVKFDGLRYEQKVMTRWRGGLDNRDIRPIASL